MIFTIQTDNEVSGINIMEALLSAGLSHTILSKQGEQLAALREAGEKMAQALRISKKYSEYCKRHPDKIIEYIEIFNLEDAEALAEWEAANK